MQAKAERTSKVDEVLSLVGFIKHLRATYPVNVETDQRPVPQSQHTRSAYIFIVALPL